MVIIHIVPNRLCHFEHIFMAKTALIAAAYFIFIVVNFYLDYSSFARSPKMTWKLRSYTLSLQCHLLVLVFLRHDDPSH